MELRNLVTGGVFGCSDEQGERLLAEGGYEKVGAVEPPVKKAAPHKAAPRKDAGAR